MNEEAKHPIIIPKDHAITRAIVNFYLVREGHAGLAHVLAAI